MPAHKLGIGSTSLVALAMATIATPAFAQSGLEDEAVANDTKEIVVTGSLIRGSREDAPAPIDVIGAEELSRQGSPSVIDLLKNLPNSSGIIGDANQFDARAQGNEGVASVTPRCQPSVIPVASKRAAGINFLCQGRSGSRLSQ